MTKHFGMQETTASPLEFLGTWKETRQLQTFKEWNSYKDWLFSLSSFLRIYLVSDGMMILLHPCNTTVFGLQKFTFMWQCTALEFYKINIC